MDLPEQNPVERGAGEATPGAQVEMVKERETKEDGRYIIFYSFSDEEEDG